MSSKIFGLPPYPLRRPKAAATEICPDCKGSGEYADWGGECPLCGGTGGAPAYRAAPSSGQEQTVAWRWTDNNGKTWRVDNTKPEPAFGRWIEPLFASPQPLTEGEPSEAEVERPNWPAIYKDVSHHADRDGELVAVTRETLRLARAAIRSAQEKEAFRAAEIEINRTLLAAKSKGGQADG